MFCDVGLWHVWDWALASKDERGESMGKKSRRRWTRERFFLLYWQIGKTTVCFLGLSFFVVSVFFRKGRDATPLFVGNDHRPREEFFGSLSLIIISVTTTNITTTNTTATTTTTSTIAPTGPMSHSQSRTLPLSAYLPSYHAQGQKALTRSRVVYVSKGFSYQIQIHHLPLLLLVYQTCRKIKYYNFKSYYLLACA